METLGECYTVIYWKFACFVEFVLLTLGKHDMFPFIAEFGSTFITFYEIHFMIVPFISLFLSVQSCVRSNYFLVMLFPSYFQFVMNTTFYQWDKQIQAIAIIFSCFHFLVVSYTLIFSIADVASIYIHVKVLLDSYLRKEN